MVLEELHTKLYRALNTAALLGLSTQFPAHTLYATTQFH